MKNERRHELQTNYLADQIGGWVEKVKPYSSLIAIGLVVLVVGIFASTYFAERSAARNAKRWEAYYRTSEKATQDRDGYLKAAKEYAGTPIEPWAALAAADAAMEQGASLQWISKKEAVKHLNAATSEYETIARSAKDPLLKQRATYSLALCQEALGKLDAAVETYRSVGGPLGEKATKRADELASSDHLKEFYDWYAKAELPKEDFRSSGADTPGLKPDFDLNSGDLGPFLPVEDDNNAAGSETDPAADSTSAGATEAPPVATEEPATAEYVPETDSQNADAPAGDSANDDSTAADAAETESIESEPDGGETEDAEQPAE